MPKAIQHKDTEEFLDKDLGANASVMSFTFEFRDAKLRVVGLRLLIRQVGGGRSRGGGEVSIPAFPNGGRAGRPCYRLRAVEGRRHGRDVSARIGISQRFASVRNDKGDYALKPTEGLNGTRADVKEC